MLAGKKPMKSRHNILRDCEKWPRQWMGMGDDVLYGKGIVEAMRPFIVALVAERLSDRTLQKHAENLWLLGGEIIRDVSTYKEYTKITPAAKLWESIGPDEDPYCRHLNSESEKRSFDATCGQLYRFLEKMKKEIKDRRDKSIINRRAATLNREAEDVLDYQVAL